MCTTDGISTFTLYQHDMRQLVTFWLAAFEYAGNGANAASLSFSVDNDGNATVDAAGLNPITL